jgi:hypothetical protein
MSTVQTVKVDADLTPAEALAALHVHDRSTRELLVTLTAVDGVAGGLGGMVHGRGSVLGTP